MDASKSTGPFAQLEEFLEEYLVRKAPYTLPEKWKLTLVKFAPWISVLVVIFALPIVFGLLGINFAILNLFHKIGGGYVVYPGMSFWNISMLLAMASLVLEVIAIPGLFKRSHSGWLFLFIASLLTIIQHILYFDFGSLLGSVLGLYFLFQVKSYYKAGAVAAPLVTPPSHA